MLIASGGTYAIAYFGRGSSYMPWIGFVFLIAHLSLNQLERQFANNPAAVDITGAQMVLVMKLSAFCWNVADGTLSDDQLSDFQKDRVLSELPGFLDYAGWVFFFPALLAGPAMDFAEYRRWLDTSMFDVPSTVDASKKPPTRKKRRIPRSATPALWKLAQGLVWILLFLVCSGSYSPNLLVSDSYMDHGLLKRIWLMYITNFVARMKYYGVWSMTEGACILSGIGYNGVDPVTGKIAWDRVTNIKPLGVELAQNTRAYLGNWNIKTNVWLRNYVYLRVTPMGKKPGFRASLATFTTSAIWHGFYPGYYLSFVLASFIQTVAKSKFDLRKTSWSEPTANMLTRFPPVLPSIFHRSCYPEANFSESVLRHFLLPGHTNRLLLRDNSVPRIGLFGQRESVGQGLFLLCGGCSGIVGILCEPCQSFDETKDRRTEQQGRRCNEAVSKHGELGNGRQQRQRAACRPWTV